MGQAEQVIFAGCSTGGMGVFRNLDWVAAKLAATAPGAIVLGAAFSGFYFFQHPYAGPGSRTVQDFSAAGFEKYLGMHKAYVNENCAAARAPQNETWMCQQAAGSAISASY